MVRHAFTMIELIFAIVVISISVMSLPMMTQVTSEAMRGNLVQEAIFASAAEINIATTFVWDDDSLSDDPTGFSRVIKTSALAHDCAIRGGIHPTSRLGHVNRQCLNDAVTTNYHITPNVTFAADAIDSTIHTQEYIYDNNATTSTSGYKQRYWSILDVDLCMAGACARQFGLEANNQNIREITITIIDENNATLTLLRTYTANIGELAYETRLLP